MDINFEINNDGKNFTVLVFEDYVLKFVKTKLIKKRDLKRITDLQNELSVKLDGILPCKLVENVIIMPKAKGVRADKLTGKKKDRAIDLVQKKRRKIKKLGYEIDDLGAKNYFYDEEKDKVWIIDFDKLIRS